MLPDKNERAEIANICFFRKVVGFGPGYFCYIKLLY